MLELKNVMSPRIIMTIILSIIVFYFYASNFSLVMALIYLPIIGLFINITRSFCYVFIGRALLPFTIALALLWAWETYHLLPQYKFLTRNALQNLSAINDFFTILSTLYAICIAFLLWKGLTDYDNLRTTLKDEASTIQSINEFFHYLDRDGGNGVIIDRIRDIFLKYITNIVQGRKIKTSQENERFLKTSIRLIAELETGNDENDKIALAEIIKEVSSLSHTRSLRASYMENGMSPYLLALLASLSICLLIPFLIKEPDQTYVIHILLFFLTSFFSFLFLTLLDINDPFDGYWSIKVDAFSEVHRFISEDKNDFNSKLIDTTSA